MIANPLVEAVSQPWQVYAYAGGMAVVFSTGQSNQTDISSDDGQFQRLSNAYLANPARLP